MKNQVDKLTSGEFADERCSGYEPTTFSKPTGSYRMQESFSTSNPYENDEYQEQDMWCRVSNHTVKIQLDPRRGFSIGSNETDAEGWHDQFRLEYTGYGEHFQYGDELPDKIASGQWFDTNSSWIHMRFMSNSAGVDEGFKFNVMCSQADDLTAGNGAEKLVISNDHTIDKSTVDSYGAYFALFLF